MRISFILLFVANIVFGQVEQKRTVSQTQLDSLFESWDDLSQPGIAYGIVNNGRVEYLKGYGLADIENKVQVTPQTKFLYNSMGHQIIAFSTYLLAEQGIIGMTDPVTEYVKDLAFLSDKVTIEALINHQAQLPDLESFKPILGIRGNQTYTAKNVSKHLEYLLKHKKYKKVGAPAIHFRILQEVIESVTGMSIRDYIQQNIFAPLEMNNTLFSENINEVIPQRAQGYYQEDNSWKKSFLSSNDAATFALYTTAEDMCKWALNFSRPKVGNKSILSKLDQFCEPQMENEQLANATMYTGQHNYWNFKGTKKQYLIGMGAGYAAKLVRFPDYDLSIVVLGNTGRYNGHWTSFMADLYLEDAYTSTPNSAETTTEFLSLSIDELKKYAGNYWSDENQFTTSISLENDTLRYFEEEHNWRMNLLPMGDGNFGTTHGDEVSFSSENGEYQLHLKISNGQIRQSKKYDILSKEDLSLTTLCGTYRNRELNYGYEVIEKSDQLFLVNEDEREFELYPISNNTFKTMSSSVKLVNFIMVNEQAKTITISNRRFSDIPFNSEECPVKHSPN